MTNGRSALFAGIHVGKSVSRLWSAGNKPSHLETQACELAIGGRLKCRGLLGGQDPREGVPCMRVQCHGPRIRVWESECSTHLDSMGQLAVKKMSSMTSWTWTI